MFKKLLSFGVNERGQLGLGDIFNRYIPTLIMNIPYSSSIFIGHYNNILKINQEYFGFGDNRNGELLLLYDDILSPTKIDFNQEIELLSLSRFSTFFYSNDILYSFGRSKLEGLYNLGYIQEENQLYPKKINFDKKIKKLISGWCNHFILTKDNELYSFGFSKEGQCGHELNINPIFPKFLMNNVKDLSCGLDHTIVLTNNNELYSFGLNNYGQLGIGNQINQLKPILIESFTHDKIINISLGWTSSFILTDHGDIYSFGSNHSGQLSHLESFLNRPKKMKVPKNIQKISSGRVHFGMIDDQENLYMIGSGKDGKLGNGNIEDSFEAVWIDQGIEQVHCGIDHTIIVQKF